MAYYGPVPFSVPAGGTDYTIAPSFNVYLSSTQSTTTGDGTQYTVPFDTVDFDITTSYDAVSHAYVCPVAGIYYFNTFIYTSGNTNVTNEGFLYFSNVTQGTGYQVAALNPFAAGYNSGSSYGYGASIVIQCAQGDNITVVLQVSQFSGAGSKVVQVLGSPGVETYFAGFLIR